MVGDNFQLNGMTDRELLLVIAQKQDNHMEAHKSLSAKVTRIEEKIIEDIDNRLRLLENANFERKGMYKFWLLIIGAVTFINVILQLSKFW